DWAVLISSEQLVVQQQPAAHGCFVLTFACLCGATRTIGSPEHEDCQRKAEQEADLECVGEQEQGLFIHGVRTYGVPVAAVAMNG
ncbi:hypothetical protein, partial [Aestuariivirga sp.]|uniref:hypothetical protein n=1 Tax=Aestuariivirga sp. TaxID=2650926 RepID=UPI0030163572